jgi:hypothetical protein
MEGIVSPHGLKLKPKKTMELKKGDRIQIKLRKDEIYQVIFIDYSTTEGIAFGKFINDEGEVQTKPFSLSSIINK